MKEMDAERQKFILNSETLNKLVLLIIIDITFDL